MIEALEKIGNWTVNHNADYKALIGIGVVISIFLAIDFYKKVLKGK
jgi:hypothetical protein